MKPVQLPLDLGHRPALGDEDFLVAPSNADAVAWLAAGRRWSAPALVLHGPAGCGKSHLTRLWCRREAAKPITPAALTIDDLPALIPPSRALALEEADRIAGCDALERALFHLFNLCAEQGGRLLLVARSPAAAWPLHLADLRSRLRGAPSAVVGPPDDALLAAMLVKLLADRQLHPPSEVVAYLVPRMERSFEAARRMAADLDRTALAAHRPITLPLARTVLRAIEAAENDSSNL